MMSSRSHLPEEIIMEDIVVKLPVKSVFRFKTLNKSWFDVITSDRFVRKHLIENPETLVAMCFKAPDEKNRDRASSWKPTPQKWVLDVYQFDDLLKVQQQQSSGSDEERGYTFTTTLPLFHLELPSFDHLVGNCYGILCFRSSDYVLLVNPSLREVKTIPTTRNPDYSNCTLDGLGYDSTTMDFKVVRITRFQTQQRVEVYSIRKAGWRKLNYPRNIPLVGNSSCSTFFNGVIYFCVSTEQGSESKDGSEDMSEDESEDEDESDEEGSDEEGSEDDGWGGHGGGYGPQGGYGYGDGPEVGLVDGSGPKSELISEWKILAFSVTSESVEIIENPCGWSDDSPQSEISPRLYVLNRESLAFVTYGTYYLNVWIRSDDNGGTWTKLYSITPLLRLKKPVCFRNMDKLLYETKEGQLILYDLINRRGTLVFDSSEIHPYRDTIGLSLSSSVQVEACGSSLVSLINV